jgi:hypothetical protein
MFVAMHTSTCSRAPSLPLLLTDLGSAPSPLAPTPHTLHTIGSAVLTPTRPPSYLAASPGNVGRYAHIRMLASPILRLLLTDLGCRALPNPQKPTEEAQTQRGDCHNEAQNPAVASSHPYPGRPEVYPHTLMFPRRQLQSKCALTPRSHTTRTTRHNFALTIIHTATKLPGCTPGDTRRYAHTRLAADPVRFDQMALQR